MLRFRFGLFMMLIVVVALASCNVWAQPQPYQETPIPKQPAIDGLPYGGGVSLSSTEWYQPGWTVEPPLEIISTLITWGVTYIRIPVNQRTWLNQEEYRNYIDNYVSAITQNKTYAVIDLHWSDQGDSALPNDQAKQQKMPDKNSVAFWEQVAQKYQTNPYVIFEIYNEPHGVTPDIWLSGGKIANGYQTVGMQNLVDTIRSEGAKNWIIVNGLDYGFNWAGLPGIRGSKIAYGTHIYTHKNYPHNDTPLEWDKAFGYLINQGNPVFISEMGDLEKCDGSFYQAVIDYAKKRNLPWIAWAAYPAKDSCGYPALLTDWSGSTTPAGEVVKDNLGK